jgi:hypothetical protein
LFFTQLLEERKKKKKVCLFTPSFKNILKEEEESNWIQMCFYTFTVWPVFWSGSCRDWPDRSSILSDPFFRPTVRQFSRADSGRVCCASI